MDGKKKYTEMFGSFMEPFNWYILRKCLTGVLRKVAGRENKNNSSSSNSTFKYHSKISKLCLLRLHSNDQQ